MARVERKDHESRAVESAPWKREEKIGRDEESGVFGFEITISEAGRNGSFIVECSVSPRSLR